MNRLGYIYAATGSRGAGYKGLVKFGFSKNPEGRVAGLGLMLIASCRARENDECELHDLLSEHRAFRYDRRKREWYVQNDTIEEMVSEIARKRIGRWMKAVFGL